MPAEQEHPNCTPQLEARPSGPGDEAQRGCIRKLGRRKAELSFFATGVLVAVILTVVLGTGECPHIPAVGVGWGIPGFPSPHPTSWAAPNHLLLPFPTSAAVPRPSPHVAASQPQPAAGGRPKRDRDRFGSLSPMYPTLSLSVRPREPCPPAPAFSHVCPNDWVGFQGKCFYFSDDQRDWNSSMELCQRLRASLATLHTEEEMVRAGAELQCQRGGGKPTLVGLHQRLLLPPVHGKAMRGPQFSLCQSHEMPSIQLVPKP
uniref:Uncharacterized protein n=1 Tax=Chrysolophus pictus TaxID=9089 RepID=A0A8C3KVD4_CHRPC